MSITVALSHEKETFETLRDEWIELQTRSSATGMAITWQWVYSFYKYFGDLGELWILTAHEDDRLIGIAPLMKVKEQPDYFFAWQQIQFIGTPRNDEHLDFIIEKGYEEQVIPLFIDKLYEHKKHWDVISLTGLYDTKTLNILRQSDHNWMEIPQRNSMIPYLTLPETEDEWTQSLSSKRRWSMRRDQKKLDEQLGGRWSITQVTQLDELDETFEHLVRLHQAKWEVNNEGNFSTTKHIEYYRELMHHLFENNWLRMYRLDIDDEPCAIDFSYHFSGRAYGAISSVNREITNVSLGHVLKYYEIAQAIREGCCEFSFGPGRSSYKYSFGCVDQVQQAVQLIKSPRVRLQIQIVNWLRRVKVRISAIKQNAHKTTSDAPGDKVGEE